jgi:hypothetical protein
VTAVKLKLEGIMRHTDLREREAEAEAARLSAARDAAEAERAALVQRHKQARPCAAVRKLP